eukprot:GHVQ01011557.1.p1 GENE.GHVQ01011557.1~~GHVQ01011557.1.p1  ORF type:complete len:572 (-),score=63.87 GHVQ01011557.1:3157-4872(-)
MQSHLLCSNALLFSIVVTAVDGFPVRDHKDSLRVSLPMFERDKQGQHVNQLVISHRGANDALPEETVAAYELAIVEGADFVECDVVVSKDGELICRHDPLLNDTTDVVEFSNRFADKWREYIIDGERKSGFFSVNFSLAELREFKCKQALPFRDQGYNGMFSLATVRELLQLVDRVNRWIETMPHNLSEEDYKNVFNDLAPDRLFKNRLHRYRGVVDRFLFSGRSRQSRLGGTRRSRSVGVYLETKHPMWVKQVTGFDVAERLLDLLVEFGYDKPSKQKLLFVESFDSTNLMWWKENTNFQIIQLVFPMKVTATGRRLTDTLGVATDDHQDMPDDAGSPSTKNVTQQADNNYVREQPSQHIVGGTKHDTYSSDRNSTLRSNPYPPYYFPPVPAVYVQDTAQQTVVQVIANFTHIATYATGIGPHKQLILPIDPLTHYLAGVTNVTEVAHELNLLVHPYIHRNEFMFLPLNFTADPYLELRWLFEALVVDGVFSDNVASVCRFVNFQQEQLINLSLQGSWASITTTGLGTLLAIALLCGILLLSRCCLRALGHRFFRLDEIIASKYNEMAPA